MCRKEEVLNGVGNLKFERVEIIEGGKELRFGVKEPIEKNGTIVFLKYEPGSVAFEKMFPVVNVDEIRLTDDFMDYEPENEIASRIKRSVIEAKENGMKNFRKPAVAPSLGQYNSCTLIYLPGNKLICDLTVEEWEEQFKRFMPEKNSRMIDDLQNDVFIANLIKYFVEIGYDKKAVWSTFCADSTFISTWGCEKTGVKKILYWYDIVTVGKLVKSHKDSGYYIYGKEHIKNGKRFRILAEAIKASSAENVSGELVLDE